MREASNPDISSVGGIGEFELIDRLSGLVGGSAAVVGIGDDAAVLDFGGTDYVLATVDMMVQDVHFELRDTDPRLIGRRAIAINVSDIAAMGGEPSFALISLALPAECPVDFVERLYEGLRHESGLTGAGIVGGNMTRTSGPICIDVTVLGRVPKDEVVLRSGARAGDILAVTGTLGGAAARRLARSSDQEDGSLQKSSIDGEPGSPVSRVSAARRLAEATHSAGDAGPERWVGRRHSPSLSGKPGWSCRLRRPTTDLRRNTRNRGRAGSIAPLPRTFRWRGLRAPDGDLAGRPWRGS